MCQMYDFEVLQMSPNSEKNLQFNDVYYEILSVLIAKLIQNNKQNLLCVT